MANQNPFDYGGPVTGDHFAGRRTEVAAIVDRLRDHIGVVVTAPRRYGKSSLIQQACLELERHEPRPAIVSVNLLRCASPSELSGLLLRRLYRVPGGSWHRVKQALPGFLRRIHIQPSTTFDDSGHPIFRFSPGLTAEDASRVVDDVYQILDEIGAKRPSVLFLDEFQAVSELDVQLARRLKALADEHRNVSLVLAGSKQHLMESLVLSKGAPLYNMLERLSLGAIPEEVWVPFLVRRSRRGGKPFADDDAARVLWRLSEPVPFDVQQLAYESFNQADTTISDSVVAHAVEALIRHQAADYAKSFEKLSGGQRRVIRTLAGGLQATTGSAEFAAAVGLADSTSVRKALTALAEAELVVRRDQRYAVDDPFFAAWLRESEGAN
jgi:AAA+ ATPase superfamily predicted ATPase